MKRELDGAELQALFEKMAAPGTDLRKKSGAAHYLNPEIEYAFKGFLLGAVCVHEGVSRPDDLTIE